MGWNSETINICFIDIINMKTYMKTDFDKIKGMGLISFA